MTGIPIFLLQPILTSSAALSSNYWLYDFNATRFQFFKKKSWTFGNFGFFLKSYLVILILMASLVFIENVQGIIDKVFREKIYGLNGFNTFFSTFGQNFWFLHVFVVVFIVIRLIVMSYWLPLHGKNSGPQINKDLSVFIDFRWKLLNLRADNTFKIFF